MDENDWLAKRFDENRAHLHSVAYRMLGTVSEADDAVQEAWLKISRSDAREVENLGGWLTTVVARVCLDVLRSRKLRREEPLAPGADAPSDSNPETDVAFADAIGPALLVVLEMLAPAERVAFVLHDMFDLPFEEIASVVGRSPEAARQLASRARRRVRGVHKVSAPDLDRRREVVDAFLAASRNGDFEALLAVLDPEVVLHADELAVRTAEANKWAGAPTLASEVRGARSVADTFKGRARAARRALIDGSPGAVWAQAGRIRAAFVFHVRGGTIGEIHIIMEPTRIGEMDVEMVAD
jgi:RNA polymerase sigma factor (sigma-70 family)